jgi:hypothetical protein
VLAGVPIRVRVRRAFVETIAIITNVGGGGMMAGFPATNLGDRSHQDH